MASDERRELQARIEKLLAPLGPADAFRLAQDIHDLCRATAADAVRESAPGAKAEAPTGGMPKCGGCGLDSCDECPLIGVTPPPASETPQSHVELTDLEWEALETAAYNQAHEPIRTLAAEAFRKLNARAGVDARPLCIRCRKPWVPAEGADATVTPCGDCAGVERVKCRRCGEPEGKPGAADCEFHFVHAGVEGK